MGLSETRPYSPYLKCIHTTKESKEISFGTAPFCLHVWWTDQGRLWRRQLRGKFSSPSLWLGSISTGLPDWISINSQVAGLSDPKIHCFQKYYSQDYLLAMTSLIHHILFVLSDVLLEGGGASSPLEGRPHTVVSQHVLKVWGCTTSFAIIEISP